MAIQPPCDDAGVAIGFSRRGSRRSGASGDKKVSLLYCRPIVYIAKGRGRLETQQPSASPTVSHSIAIFVISGHSLSIFQITNISTLGPGNHL